MKRKIVILIAWLLFTGFYVWNLSDIGRSMGASTNSAIENYVEYYTGEYAGAEGVADGIENAWSYSNFNNLESNFKGYFTVIGITTIVYIVISALRYHLAFIRAVDKNRG